MTDTRAMRDASNDDSYNNYGSHHGRSASSAVDTVYGEFMMDARQYAYAYNTRLGNIRILEEPPRVHLDINRLRSLLGGEGISAISLLQ